MLLQRRSQIYRSQSVSAAESVFSSVSFLIRIRELLLVLKASKKIASNPPFPAPPNPSLHLAPRSFSLPFFSLSLSLSLCSPPFFPSLSSFSSFYVERNRYDGIPIAFFSHPVIDYRYLLPPGQPFSPIYPLPSPLPSFEADRTHHGPVHMIF